MKPTQAGILLAAVHIFAACRCSARANVAPRIPRSPTRGRLTQGDANVPVVGIAFEMPSGSGSYNSDKAIETRLIEALEKDGQVTGEARQTRRSRGGGEGAAVGEGRGLL